MLKKYKSKKYKIGYTSGVFDLFHVGHLNILKKAKSICEFLIVSVSSDELVLDYKNKKPIINLKDRMEIVKSIKYVDKVVVQNSLDKIIAHKKYRFDVLIQGDDWIAHDRNILMTKQLKLINVPVLLFPYTSQISSSKLRDLLKNSN